MPNWCWSNITFYSEKQSQIQKLHDDFLKISSGKATVENSFGSGWMGDYANYYLKAVGGSETVDCRGEVSDITDVFRKNSDIYYFQMNTQTAWSPKIAIWREIVENNYLDVDIAYCSEESGTEIYNLWDELGMFYNFQYILSSAHNGEYFDIPDIASKKELIQELKEIYNISFDEILSVDDIVNFINQQTKTCDNYDADEEYLYVNIYADVEPAEYDLLM